MSNKSNRRTWYSFILYKDTTSYNIDFVISSLCKWSEEYYYILHNMENEKEHFHFISKLKNPKEVNEIRNHCQIDNEYSKELIKPIDKKDINKALVYLIHLNAPKKYQYQDFLVETNQPFKFNQICSSFMEGKSYKLVRIYKFIRENPNKLTLEQIEDYCIENQLFDFYIKNSYYFSQLMNRHNKYFIKNDKGEY